MATMWIVSSSATAGQSMDWRRDLHTKRPANNQKRGTLSRSIYPWDVSTFDSRRWPSNGPLFNQSVWSVVTAPASDRYNISRPACVFPYLRSGCGQYVRLPHHGHSIMHLFILVNAFAHLLTGCSQNGEVCIQPQWYVNGKRATITGFDDHR